MIHESENSDNTVTRAYNFFGDYLWKRHGARVLKLSVDAGLSCPNLDGTVGTHGCIFCYNGSAAPTSENFPDILDQMQNARDSFRRADESTKYIAYFQAYTNTYGNAGHLKSLYDRALSFPGVIGLMIGTRPDSLPGEVIELIASYKHEGFELWIELGMQTMHDASLRWLRRGHDHRTTIDAIKRITLVGIPVCVHLILGIPGESWKDMMLTAREVSGLPVSGIKFHQLQIIRGTPLDWLNRKNRVPMMGITEYASTLCDFLERTRPDILVHRLMADRSEDLLVAPSWSIHKGTVLNAIDTEFSRRQTHQGFLADCPRAAGE